jgi:hypothetical protein
VLLIIKRCVYHKMNSRRFTSKSAIQCTVILHAQKSRFPTERVTDATGVVAFL